MKKNPFGPIHSQTKAPEASAAPSPANARPVTTASPASPMPFAPPMQGADPFDRDRFLLKQRALSISEKYDVCDEAGNRIILVRRPAMVLRSIAALVAAIFTFIVGMAAFVALAVAVAGPKDGAIAAAILIVGLIVTTVATVAVAILISPRRHVTMFADETMTQSLVHVRQEQKLAFLTMRYTVTDPAGTALCVLRKNYLYDIFRKKWVCEKPDGTPMCMIREDSLFKAFLRRFVGEVFGPFMRTNFIITDPSEQKQLGKFDRKFTILDRYVLDMTQDPERSIDRRIALAIGVMLDTGERR